MAAVAGLRGTGDWATDERPKNFREYILWRNPNGTAPIFALSAKAQKESTTDPEFSWWDEPNHLVRFTINFGAGYGTGDTVLTIDSADPDASNPVLNWGIAQHAKPGDLFFVEPSVDAALLAGEVIEVLAVNSATEVVVRRGAAGTTAAAIADNANLLKIGSAYAEGTPEPDATSRNPIKYFNYTQIFKDAYEISNTAAATTTRTGDTMKNSKKRKAFDHARDIEWAILFGRRSEVVDPTNGKPKRTFGGIRSFLGATTAKLLGAAWPMTELLDAVSPVFNYDTEAGNSRMVFAGNSALNHFNKKVMAQTGAVNINFSGEKSVYGMAFKEYTVPQGTLLIKTHPLLNLHPLYQNSWFIMDFSALRWRPLKGRDTRMMDDIQTKGEDLTRGQWLTEAGIELRYGGLTCGYVGGFNL